MNLLKEFKAFAVKGNVIDLAVGVIIGAAFTKIVTSLVDDLIMPPLGVLMGKVDFSEHFLILKAAPDGAREFPTVAAAKAAGATPLGYGNFINVSLQFVIVAFTVFLLVKQINRLKNRHHEDQAKAAAAAPPPPPSNEEKLLAEIRDLLKQK